MKKLTSSLVIAIASLGLALGGCKKKEEDKPATPTAGTATTGTGTGTGTGAGTGAGTGTGTAATGTTGTGAGTGMGTDTTGTGAGTGTGAATTGTPATAGDYVKVHADHVDATKGKVEVVFSKWEVKSAKFDPANLEGGTAELDIEAGSLSSGIADRDAHLNTPDFLDTVKWPKINVKVDNVKKAGSDKAYTADATVNMHGVEKKIPVKFDVVASTADSVTIKTNTPFSRKDWNVGGDGGPKDTVKFDLILDAQLTLKKM